MARSDTEKQYLSRNGKSWTNQENINRRGLWEESLKCMTQNEDVAAGFARLMKHLKPSADDAGPMLRALRSTGKAAPWTKAQLTDWALEAVGGSVAEVRCWPF